MHARTCVNAHLWYGGFFNSSWICLCLSQILQYCGIWDETERFNHVLSGQVSWRIVCVRPWFTCTMIRNMWWTQHIPTRAVRVGWGGSILQVISRYSRQRAWLNGAPHCANILKPTGTISQGTACTAAARIVSVSWLSCTWWKNNIPSVTNLAATSNDFEPL